MPKYIYPPRTDKKITPAQLDAYQSQGGWLWQRKFNGDRCIVVIENGKVYLGNRHGRFHHPAKYPLLRQELAKLALPNGNCCLDGELLDPKIKETVVLFDVLQFGGEYLYGREQPERLKLLQGICRTPSKLCDQKIALQVSERVWMAETGDDDFVAHFREFLHLDLIEGLVLRSKGGRLDGWGDQEYRVNWMVRCRKPAINYRF